MLHKVGVDVTFVVEPNTEICDTTVSGVGLSPALAPCETSQVLLAGVPGGFSPGTPVFTHLLIGLSHMS